MILQIERNPKTFLLYDNKRQVYDHVIFLGVSAGQGILEDKEKLCLVYVPFCSLKRYHISEISEFVVMDFTNSEVELLDLIKLSSPF